MIYTGLVLRKRFYVIGGVNSCEARLIILYRGQLKCYYVLFQTVGIFGAFQLVSKFFTTIRNILKNYNYLKTFFLLKKSPEEFKTIFLIFSALMSVV